MEIVINRHATMVVWKLEICITAWTMAHVLLMKGKPVIIYVYSQIKNRRYAN
jgi:hypothetical protein